jgi:hypothetical protein
MEGKKSDGNIATECDPLIRHLDRFCVAATAAGAVMTDRIDSSDERFRQAAGYAGFGYEEFKSVVEETRRKPDEIWMSRHGGDRVLHYVSEPFVYLGEKTSFVYAERIFAGRRAIWDAYYANEDELDEIREGEPVFFRRRETLESVERLSPQHTLYALRTPIETTYFTRERLRHILHEHDYARHRLERMLDALGSPEEVFETIDGRKRHRYYIGASDEGAHIVAVRSAEREADLMDAFPLDGCKEIDQFRTGERIYSLKARRDSSSRLRMMAGFIM